MSLEPQPPEGSCVTLMSDLEFIRAILLLDLGHFALVLQNLVEKGITNTSINDAHIICIICKQGACFYNDYDASIKTPIDTFRQSALLSNIHYHLLYAIMCWFYKYHIVPITGRSAGSEGTSLRKVLFRSQECPSIVSNSLYCPNVSSFLCLNK